VKYHGDKARWVVDAWTDTSLAPEFANWNLDGALARIRCPVLAIHGERDEYGSVKHPSALRVDGEEPKSFVTSDTFPFARTKSMSWT
jgi:fermentation-respiration switch protein FrsA (DUF1100 family)